MSSPSEKSVSSRETKVSRVTDFEETLTFQQRALDELSEVVLRQQGELEQLRREMRQLREEVERAAELASSELPPDEKSATLLRLTPSCCDHSPAGSSAILCFL